jgi:uncharacterized membrane protein
MYERGWGHHDGAWFWMARLGFVVVMAALLALAVVLLVRAVRQRPAAVVAAGPVAGNVAGPIAAPVAGGPLTVSPNAAEDAVVQALRLRYARGDISRDEYQRIAADLAIAVPADVSAASPSSPDPTERVDGT